MSTGQVITNKGKLIFLNRGFKPTPDYSVPTVFKIGTGTTTPTVSDTDIETAVTIDGNPTKGFVVGYPALDETNLQATIRCLLLSTESNGNNLTEFGLFNTDGSALMFSHAVHAPISKTSSVEVTYIEKDKII